eukprot:4479472-Pyramimonas_sp.AAC.1
MRSLPLGPSVNSIWATKRALVGGWGRARTLPLGPGVEFTAGYETLCWAGKTHADGPTGAF